jgi:hypothetical protein
VLEETDEWVELLLLELRLELEPERELELWLVLPELLDLEELEELWDDEEEDE